MKTAERRNVGERQAKTFELNRESALQMARLDGPIDVHVSCLTGTLWLTQLGDPRDYVLTAGQGMEFHGNATVVINPLDSSSICTLINLSRQPWEFRVECGTWVMRRDASAKPFA